MDQPTINSRGGQRVDSPDTESNENLPLLVRKRVNISGTSCFSAVALRCRYTRKCINSKAALLLLLWSFIILLAHGVANNVLFYLCLLVHYDYSLLISEGSTGVIFLFFPLSAFLADVKFGRYKTILASLYILLIAVVPIMIALGLITPYMYHAIHQDTGGNDLFLLFQIGFGLFSLFAIFLLIGYIGFTANVLQFGLEQLLNSPVEDHSLFIHWYVWVYNINLAITQVAWDFIAFPYESYSAISNIGLAVVTFVPLLLAVLLLTSLCIARQKKKWFLIEPGRINPYKLVCMVSKFAYQHKIPIHRSSFTYYDSEFSSRLGLSKDKYGGPFTMDQVENVKAFYGIIKVMLSFGVAFFLSVAVRSALPLFSQPDGRINYVTEYNITQVEELLLIKGTLPYLLIAAILPLYVIILRPLILHYVPGILKRMGIGIFLMLLSLLLSFSMDTVAHYQFGNLLCSNDSAPSNTSTSLLPEVVYTLPIVLQNILSALSHLLIHISSMEFICTQTPHSMKGLFVGLLYAIRGFFQVIGAALTPLVQVQISSLPTCGFLYYIMNIVMGVIGFIVFVWVARKYKYRKGETNHESMLSNNVYS